MEIPTTIVYYTEVRVNSYSDILQLIPALGAECMELKPGMKCQDPPYEFCEYLDEEHKETDTMKYAKENGLQSFRCKIDSIVLL